MKIKAYIKKNKTLYNLALRLLDSIQYYRIKYNYVNSLKRDFFKHTGYKLNLDSPKTINEKMQWLKCYYRDPIMTECADKARVRNIIAKAIGKEYLVPIYGVYTSVDEINLEKLPNSFVLKPTHSSGRVIICRDKKSLDWKAESSKLKKWMKENYYYQNGEWCYKDIKPRIICEKLLTGEIIDYKFMCFYGIPAYTFVCSERNIKLKVTCVDNEFKILPFHQKYPTSSTLKKPKNFNKMIELSKVLSKKFPHVRVDFYDQDGKIYFGELTFFDSNGMEEYQPKEWNRKIGDLLDLNKINKEYIKKSRERAR